jgi:hypothetical protein
MHYLDRLPQAADLVIVVTLIVVILIVAFVAMLLWGWLTEPPLRPPHQRVQCPWNQVGGNLPIDGWCPVCEKHWINYARPDGCLGIERRKAE